MSTSEVLHPDGDEFDAFLFSEVGNDRTGVAVTVLSALARLNIEPWTEARELSHLGREDAVLRLSAHLETITDMPRPASERRAANLLALLPKRVPFRTSKPREAGAGNLAKLSASKATFAIAGIIILVWFFYLK